MRGHDYVPDKEAMAVEIQLINGDLRKGKLWVPAGKSLADVLNGTQAFIEFTPFDETWPRHVAKAQIAFARLVEIPKFVPLHERRGVAGGDDPHEILAVAVGAPWCSVRESYLRLAKIYHPDKFSGVELPKEVVEYIGAKARRINAAYALLEDSFKLTAREPAAEPTRAHA